MATKRDGVAAAFWRRVIRETNARGMTQQELVERSGIPHSTLNRLRTVTQPPLARTIIKLCQILDIDEEEGMVLSGRVSYPARQDDLRRQIEESAMISEGLRIAMLAMYDAYQEAQDRSMSA